jgi:hypothetical protein
MQPRSFSAKQSLWEGKMLSRAKREGYEVPLGPSSGLPMFRSATKRQRSVLLVIGKTNRRRTTPLLTYLLHLSQLLP